MATKLIHKQKFQNIRYRNIIIDKIKKLKTYHHAYVTKIQNRDLTHSELRYMARYHAALESFLKEKNINLVLMHNDQRWYHAIAIEICKENKIKYIVTEQGLLRPYTTVLDNVGVNANSSISIMKNKNFTTYGSDLPKFQVNSKHDSNISMCFFSFFLILFWIERTIGSKTIIRYMHNGYNISKYLLRFKTKIQKKLFEVKKMNLETDYFNKSYVLLLLQLEYDSQLLVHSEFSNNQQIINEFERQFKNKEEFIYIKKHPLDVNKYEISKKSRYVTGTIEELSENAKAVFTVNSSSALSVITTNTALFLLGESMFDHEGIAKKIQIADVGKYNKNTAIDRQKRDDFLNYIKNRYLICGAGWSYNDNVLDEAIKRLINN